jgi:hypothetical protein
MGRSAIIMVMGLSLALAIFIPNTFRYSTQSYQNYLNYYYRTNAHYLAVSAANIAADSIYLNSAYRGSFSSDTLNGGTMGFSVTAISGTNFLQVMSYSKYQPFSGDSTYVDTNIVILQPSSFAKFCVALQTMSGVSWATGDTVWGPLHVQGTLNVSGVPVFEGKVTVLTGTSPATLPSGSTNPKFLGGYQSGVSDVVPLSLYQVDTGASNHGKLFHGYASGSGVHMLTILFKSNGKMKFTETKGATVISQSGPNDTLISSLAPNSVIVIDTGCITVHGVFHGVATIGATGAYPNGNVYIDSNLTYATDPQTTAGSTDILGIVCDDSVLIPLPPTYVGTSGGNHSVLNTLTIEAALFCRTGGFAPHLDSHMGAQGDVTVYGSLASYSIGAFGVFSGSTLSYGYSNRFPFDQRFLSQSPPDYPNTGNYEVLAWRE